jgi:transcriptional regulator with XRE-family HTH domain
MLDPEQTIEILCCYAREDHRLRDELERHLGALKRSGKVTVWYDRKIAPGAEWEHEIITHIDTAQVILLLISHYFIDSDYCYGIEMKRAIERHAAREAYVIPILLRPVDWKGTPISSLQLLPRNNRPLIQWRPREEGFSRVATEIRTVVNKLFSPSEYTPAQLPPSTEGDVLRLTDHVVIAAFDLERFQLLLQFERKRRQWSVQELADRMQLGTTSAMIDAWEQGQNAPGLFHRQKLCELFQMTPEQFGWTEIPQQQIGNRLEREQPHRHVPSPSPRENRRTSMLDSVEYLCYLSQHTITTLYEQIPDSWFLARQWEERPPARVRQADPTKHITLMLQLKVVLAYLEAHAPDDIGTVDDPRKYISGTLPMFSFFLPQGNGLTEKPELIYYGGSTQKTILGLGGAPAYVFHPTDGKMMREVSSALPYLVSVLAKEARVHSIYSDPSYNDEQLAISAIESMERYDRPIRQLTHMKFFAKLKLDSAKMARVKDEPRILLASPLYVAYAE